MSDPQPKKVVSMVRKSRLRGVWLVISFTGALITGAIGLYYHQCYRQSVLINLIRSNGGIVLFSEPKGLLLKGVSRIAPQEYCCDVYQIAFSRVSDPVVFRHDNEPKIEVDSLLEEVSRIDSLQVLVLDNSQLSHVGLNMLRKLDDLRELHVCGTVLGNKEIEAISKIDSLKSLNFYAAKFNPTDLTFLARLKSLEELSLTFTTVDDESLLHVGKLSSIEMLHLGHTRITNRGLSHLVALDSLKHLEITDNDLDDDCVEPIQKLRLLKTLNLENTRLTEKGIAQIKEVLPNLSVRFGPVEISWR